MDLSIRRLLRLLSGFSGRLPASCPRYADCEQVHLRALCGSCVQADFLRADCLGEGSYQGRWATCAIKSRAGRGARGSPRRLRGAGVVSSTMGSIAPMPCPGVIFPLGPRIRASSMMMAHPTPLGSVRHGRRPDSGASARRRWNTESSEPLFRRAGPWGGRQPTSMAVVRRGAFFARCCAGSRRHCALPARDWRRRVVACVHVSPYPLWLVIPVGIWRRAVTRQGPGLGAVGGAGFCVRDTIHAQRDRHGVRASPRSRGWAVALPGSVLRASCLGDGAFCRRSATARCLVRALSACRDLRLSPCLVRGPTFANDLSAGRRRAALHRPMPIRCGGTELYVT